MKVHLGCGSVFLIDWFNVDIRSPKTFLAKDRPDLVEKWRTTEDDYYGRHKDVTVATLRKGPLDQEYVCDAYGSFADLPISYIDEVLARHSFEHLSITEARQALNVLYRTMKPGGILRIDVPDHEMTLAKLMETRDPFYVRHLLGPRRGDHGFHMMSYTPDRLKSLVEEHGFSYVAEEKNIHFYPAFCLRFVRKGLPAPREYVKPPYPIQDGWRVCDIGPGPYPLKRADVYIDRDKAILDAIDVEEGQLRWCADINDGLRQVEDKSFDYVWCSHVLEHTSNLRECIATLNRIGKRGCVVVPSAIKESITNFEEPTHRWLVLPNPQKGGPTVFIRRNEEYISRLKDETLRNILVGIYRTGTAENTQNDQYVRAWFAVNEPVLDIVIYWDENAPLTALIIE